MLLDPTFVAIQVLNGLQLSMLLFLLAVGLSVVFGLMNFVNLAHGALYALGAYLGLSCVRLTGSVWLAFALAPLGVTLIGVALYATLLRRLVSESPMTQILATFGLMLVAVDAVRMAWGNLEHSLPSPAGLTGSVEILGQAYPVYRLFIIALGGLIMAALYVGLERTRFGAIIRAGVDNRVMAASLGIDVGRRVLLGILPRQLSRWAGGRGGGRRAADGAGHGPRHPDPHARRRRGGRAR